MKSYLERKTADKTLTVMDWNWNKRQPTYKKELWEVLKEAEYNIREDYWRKFQDSLPKNVQDLQREVTTDNWFLPLETIFFNIVYIFPVFSGCILIKTLRIQYVLSLQPCLNNKWNGGQRLLHSTVHVYLIQLSRGVHVKIKPVKLVISRSNWVWAGQPARSSWS